MSAVEHRIRAARYAHVCVLFLDIMYTFTGNLSGILYGTR